MEAKIELENANAAHEAAQGKLKAALAAYDANPTDAAWSDVEAARRSLERRSVERKASLERVRRAEAEDVERARLAALGDDAERLGELRKAFCKRTIDKHVAKVLAAERAVAAAFAALEADVAELGEMRAEAVTLAARLGVDPELPVETTLARVKALVSVAENRTITPFVALTQAPEPARERARFLCQLLDESPCGEEIMPYADQVPALLNGTYREKKRAASEAHKAEQARRRADAEARLRAKEREVWAREQEHSRPRI